MRALGNVLWHFPFLGFISAAIYWIFGAILTVTVVAAPIGLGLMQYAKFLLAPFGSAMVRRDVLAQKQNAVWRVYSWLVSIVYLPFGLVFALISIVQVAFCFIGIFTIPVALVVARSLGTVLNPVGKVCVPIAVADEIDRRKGQAQIAKHLGPSA